MDVRRLVQLVDNAFPKSISTKQGITLERKIYIIGDSENNSLLSDQNNNSNDDEIYWYFKDRKNPTVENIIKTQIFQLIDENLGKLYKKKSKKIYENDLDWSINKREEMFTSNMIYITYWDCKQNSVALFLSILSCEETYILENNDQGEVLYLYEIHITKEYQRQGIGERLIKDYLIEKLIKPLKIERQDNNFIGLELTVFSENNDAQNFYFNKIQMQYTFGSPRDEIINVMKRITRSFDEKLGEHCEDNKLPSLNDKKKQLYRKSIRKPEYYILVFPV
ncbi:hypothetical protein TBLA_0G02220 [Henningerozyma blattae CBS 6284]|uniref:N-alpha-acetyltransferase 40 n=1 Tax=Henningerozyma blattae (strain ATCC 34711 / CBS 6284 / DSM 70876 / NBRC 10599 / NRRL Y-10934 / UCD 77-7) TaxID=1071380 RepID=I2H710_HENB6|nr:hypothetical protein TBLA_0G02220 [Tetrapisispora blattae CBS 6284]CCH62162.1 hypothetical protein TBLA_0G02220 [Tetrapisispora blattae CBS 6284]